MPRAKSPGSSPTFATVNARFASPYRVAFTPDAVASSAAALMMTKPAEPRIARPASASACPALASMSGRVITMTTIRPTTTYTAITMPSARYMARGNCFLGFAMSPAEFVTTPKPS